MPPYQKKPMLAPTEPLDLEKDLETNKLYIVQPKYDGIRITFFDDEPLTRSGKAIPNKIIRDELSSTYRLWLGSRLDSVNLDGELLIWNPLTNWWDPFNTVQSVVMSKERNSLLESRSWRYVVFDAAHPRKTYCERLKLLQAGRWPFMDRFFAAKHYAMRGCGVVAACREFIAEGYEGAIVRDPQGFYNFGGRSPAVRKYVEWVRDEARIVDLIELQHNADAGNSKCKDSLYPGNKLGALVVEHPRFGRFEIGTGFTDLQRRSWWENHMRPWMLKQIATFKYRPSHMKDKPCPAVFVGFRGKEDL